MNSPDLLTRLHQKGLTAHEFRLFFVDRSAGISLGKADEASNSEIPKDKLNPFTKLRKIDIRDALRRMPYDYEDTNLETQDAMEEAIYAIVDAERPAQEVLIAGQYIGLGYASPPDQTVTAIPQHHWHFLSVDFDESAAFGKNLSYIGLRFLDSTTFSEKELNGIKEIKQPENKVGETSSTTINVPLGSLEEFREMTGLGWLEVTITLVAGDLIEVAARDVIKRVTYGEFGLIDKRIGKGVLSEPGKRLLDIATNKLAKHPQHKKHFSRLRVILKAALGIKGNPIPAISISGPTKYSPQFNLVDARKRADKRARKRATHTEFKDDIDYSAGAALSDELTEIEEERPFDEENDGTAKWIKNNS